MSFHFPHYMPAVLAFITISDQSVQMPRILFYVDISMIEGRLNITLNMQLLAHGMDVGSIIIRKRML